MLPEGETRGELDGDDVAADEVLRLRIESAAAVRFPVAASSGKFDDKTAKISMSEIN